jgi:hypothetical protein
MANPSPPPTQQKYLPWLTRPGPQFSYANRHGLIYVVCEDFVINMLALIDKALDLNPRLW